MFCPKCGDKVEQNEVYCNKCGNYLGNSVNNSNYITQNNVPNAQFNNYNGQYYSNKNMSNKNAIFIGIGIGLIILVFMGALIVKNKNNYYFSDDNYEIVEDTEEKPVNNSNQKKGKYSTVIITDNVYEGIKISTENDANELIVKDSVSQKHQCPTEIKEIENKIINKYNVTAVNLCEMDIDFAKEVEKVFEKVYQEYPSVKGYLTNFSLTNASNSEDYVAAFLSAFVFGTSDTYSGYPLIMKTQIFLNTKYYLNPSRLEAAVKSSSDVGHFPKNATRYSPVAHELGHYLSFLAAMRNYDLDSMLLVDNKNESALIKVLGDFNEGRFTLQMIKEAYENYKKEIGTNLNIDEWRGQISKYAVAKDNEGNYIYDETIAEAFHDVYLNGDDSTDVSRYVVDVLKKKLEG